MHDPIEDQRSIHWARRPGEWHDSEEPELRILTIQWVENRMDMFYYFISAWEAILWMSYMRHLIRW